VTMRADRRKEPRYVVIGMQATLQGRPCTIVDISRTGVRLLRPAGELPDQDRADIVFALPPGRRLRERSFAVEGRLLRSTALELVYVYQPPRPHWGMVLRCLDTFAQTELVPL
jgi:hypothetical protein